MMTDKPAMPGEDEVAVSFAGSFVKSEAFMMLFREGMTLVEATASYLDGDGRDESAALPRDIAITYATESMRLTTRLMQIASWLLLQRAVAEGEMTPEQARSDKHSVRMAETMLAPTEDEGARLPERLRELIASSVRLRDRIRHLDGVIAGSLRPASANPVRSQIEQLQNRLGARR
jgi:regulator of CtrA degradation